MLRIDPRCKRNDKKPQARNIMRTGNFEEPQIKPVFRHDGTSSYSPTSIRLLSFEKLQVSNSDPRAGSSFRLSATRLNPESVQLP